MWRTQPSGAACGAERKHQPVGGGVQHQHERVGERALAGGAVGGEVGLVLLDEVLGLAAGAVDPPRRAELLLLPGLRRRDRRAANQNRHRRPFRPCAHRAGGAGSR